MNLRFLAVAVMALALPAHGEEAQPARFVSVTIDNDLFAGYDQHYTNGLQVAWPWSKDTIVAIGHRIYTPIDTSTRVADPSDRPYAGWLYGLLDKRFSSEGVVDHLTLTLGIVGPSARGQQLQNAVHQALGKEPSKGWEAQLPDEAVASIGYERSWPALLRGSGIDLSPRLAATFGNVLTYASAGTVLRYGNNLPSDLPATHISLGPPRDGYRGTASFGWYVWAGLDARAVARNIFLDGNTWKDSAEVDRRPFGYDVQVGVVAAWPAGRLGFTWVRRSAEFRGQAGADQFGQLAFSVAY